MLSRIVRPIWGLLGVLLLSLCPVANPAGAAEDLWTLEAGLEQAQFTDALGPGNGQFLRLTWERPRSHTLALGLGRAHRWDDTSLDAAALYTRHLRPDTDLWLGLGGGTGDFIAPEYRLDAGVLRKFLPGDTLHLSAGYTHIQSKEENSTDGLLAGASWYLEHWLLSGVFHYDIGQPGDTVSRTWVWDVTWYRYRDVYLGAGYSDGSASYVLVGPGRPLIDYRVEGWRALASKWLGADWGGHLRYDHTWTSYYTVDSYTVSVFKEF